MTRTFIYTFDHVVKKEGTDGHKISDWYTEKITLKKSVTDKMEERDGWKACYAATYFERLLRTKYGLKNHPVYAICLKEI